MVKTVKKSKAQKKTFVLDTNVLLSDSESLMSFQDNNVVLPLIVIEELDRHKDRQDDTGKNAREVSRKLIELVRDHKNEVKSGIKLGKNLGALRVLNQKDLESNVVISIPELDGSKGDNKIIQFCLEFKQKFNDERLILVTRDLLLRIKAISVGIECEDYKKLSKELLVSMNMPSSEDEFYTGIKTFKVSKEEMDVIYASGDAVTLTKSEESGLYPNQFVVFQCEETNAKWAGRYLEPGKPLKKVPFQRTAWGLKSRNMEQAFLLDLLLDDQIKLVTISSKSGAGKAQPLDAKVLTPNGWTTMGEIKVGDLVVSANGNPTHVTGVFPQGDKEIYRVTFSDGTSTECCDDHLWLVKTRKQRLLKAEGNIKSLREIKDNLHNNGCRVYSIPMTAPVEFQSKQLPLDPYLLGILLGDGSLSTHSIGFSTSDQEILDQVTQRLPSNCKIVKKFRKYDYGIKDSRTRLEKYQTFDRVILKSKNGELKIATSISKFAEENNLSVGSVYKLIKGKVKQYKGWTLHKKLDPKIDLRNAVTVALSDLGLINSKSQNKFIPDIYKYNTVDARINLLHGLIDTDGTIGKAGYSVIYYTASNVLAKDVQELVWSLGGKATISNKQTSFKYKGVKKLGLPSYCVHISLPENILPCKLSRKLSRYKPRSKYQPTRFIDSVELVGVKQAQCISVEDESHLYLTNDYIVTHNTLLSLAAALEQTLTKKKYSKILITRNVQPMGKDIGYLPGPVPLYTKVLTPTGWTTMGELKVGSSVIAKDGTATKVTGVYPKGKKEILKITFEDGAIAECCEDHPWSIYLPHANKKSRVWSTKQIEAKINGTDQTKAHNRISIDLVDPVEYNSGGKLPVHPYILGAVLGDGCVSQKYATEFSTNDIELVDRINRFLPKDIILKNKSGLSYSFTMKENLNCKSRVPNNLNKEITKLGLRGTNSSTKFIPEQYMFSSVEDRLLLLQGLMDTDGYVSADGSDVSLTTVSKQLAYNFRDLVLSLGGFAKVNFNEKKFNSYIVSVSFTNPKFTPFLLQRKADRYKSRKYNRRRRIDTVERTGKFVEMQCISVAHHSHLYVMNDFIVTHNTLEEKLGPWLAPFKDNLEFLLNENVDDAMDKGATASKKKNEVFKNTFMMQDLFEKGIIQMEATTFIRGRSIPNCFFIIDEVQNMNLHEIKTVLTRAGEGTKIILLGDPGQIDNTYVNKFSNGLTIASEKFKNQSIAGHIMLVNGERSELANTAATIFDT